MVRLKQVNDKVFVIRIDSLNSTMVRLKHQWFNNKETFTGSLNSTMVRLKRWIGHLVMRMPG